MSRSWERFLLLLAVTMLLLPWMSFGSRPREQESSASCRHGASGELHRLRSDRITGLLVRDLFVRDRSSHSMHQEARDTRDTDPATLSLLRTSRVRACRGTHAMPSCICQVTWRGRCVLPVTREGKGDGLSGSGNVARVAPLVRRALRMSFSIPLRWWCR